MRSYGYLKYDPKYTKSKGSPTRYEEGWIILTIDGGITSYYQWWLKREGAWPVSSRDWLEKAKLDTGVDVAWPIMQRGIKLNNSAWGSHVSIVRGERDFESSRIQGYPAIFPNKNWKKYENKKVWFEFDPQYLNTNGKHWWIRITSKELEDIRLELGLTSQPRYFHRDSGEWRTNPFHLTIGHMLN